MSSLQGTFDALEVRTWDYSGYKTVIVQPNVNLENGVSKFTGAKLYKGSTDIVNAKFKLLICGYCRFITEYIVPNEIISLCQAYYKIEFDKWDADTTSVNYRVNHKILTKLWNYGTHKWSNAFGTKIIERYDHRVWRIKIIKLSEENNKYDDEFRGVSGWLMNNTHDKSNNSIKIDGPLFGIIPCDKTHLKNVDITADGYVLNVSNGKCINKNISKQYIKNMNDFTITNGDVISITLNLIKQKHGTLTFMVNGKYFGVAYDNIDTDLNWKLCLAATVPSEFELLL